MSGHIDVAHRQRTENFLPYLTGEKRLVPKSGDLTFYNWARGRAELQSTPNFEVLVAPRGSRLLLRHRASGAEVDTTGIGEGSKEEEEGEEVVQPTASSGGFHFSGWRKIKIADDFGTVVFVYDIRFPKAIP